MRGRGAHGGIVAPPDYWHIHEVGGYAIWAERNVGEVDRNWMTAMPPWSISRTSATTCAPPTAWLPGRILLTGHYGPNWEDLKTLLELVQPHVGTRLCGLPDFEANRPASTTRRSRRGDHAAVETSLLWALEPDCVDFPASRRPTTRDRTSRWAAPRTNRRTGERMVADEVTWLADRATGAAGRL